VGIVLLSYCDIPILYYGVRACATSDDLGDGVCTFFGVFMGRVACSRCGTVAKLPGVGGGVAGGLVGEEDGQGTFS